MNLPPTRFARLTTFAVAALAGALAPAADSPRLEMPLLDGWRTTASEDPKAVLPGFEMPGFDDASWRSVSVPHNWDGYEGFRQVKHGVRHGAAWYRKNFTLKSDHDGRAIFLFFEGVGSYAEIWLNGQHVGAHAGGLTTFTLEVTDAIRFGDRNTLAVRAGHPAHIRDLPWVCGGCELAYGFSEGTQPFGISRPVTLVVTDPLRIAPFGLHAWNDEDLSTIRLSTEVSNHGAGPRAFSLRNRLLDATGETIAESSQAVELAPGETGKWAQAFSGLEDAPLWSPHDPYLHTIVTELLVDGVAVDRLETPYGLRYIAWPDLHGPPGEPLRLNGEPFFINGVADYEHLLGQSHAFSAHQVEARAGQIISAGFNTFRDAHHPHNLRFNEIWDREGLLWWTQFGAHIWFDNEAFRENYQRLLRDWIKERRNSPSLFLYGLQNESKLPAWFAEECAAIIRELDPTASIQRPITTCNGGEGTDWDVPQNWSGTYGGDPHQYGRELIDQRLVGEYGAWRSLGFHAEGGFIYESPLTEDRMAGLLEIKLREAEAVRDSVIGHFMWPFTTHQNPGRNVGGEGQQMRDGMRPLDRIGPANNKGLFSIWGEPTDAFYMYRSNYADPATDPMVYIVSHTWSDRWTGPGRKDGIIVYSNCEEVELFNGVDGTSLGTRTRGGKGTHFRWDGVEVQSNLLIARGRVGGKGVAEDALRLKHLPPPPGETTSPHATAAIAPLAGQHYLYRVNAGGTAFRDAHDQLWQADRVWREGDAWGSVSWGGRFPNLDPRFGSRRPLMSAEPLDGGAELFASYRYGRDELRYVFNVPDGHYTVELFFLEPSHRVGGVDATGWRLFDVAINDETVIQDLDLFALGFQRFAFPASARDGRLEVSFPRVAAGQAVISGLAISTADASIPVPPVPSGLFAEVEGAQARTWLDTGVRFHPDTSVNLSALSWELYDAEWLQLPSAPAAGPVSFRVTVEANLYAAFPGEVPSGWEPTEYTLATTAAPEQALALYRRAVEADTSVRFPSPPRALLAEYRYPPAPANGIAELEVSGSEDAGGWQAIGHFKAGVPLYSDGGPAIARFSSRLSDSDWIRPPRADAANPDLAVSFSVDDHTEVHVALDARVQSLPAWMTGWIPSRGWTLHATDDPAGGHVFWKKRLLPGETIHLGPNATLPEGGPARMYVAVVQTVRAAFTLQIEHQDNAAALVAFTQPGFTGDGYVDLGRLEGDTFTVFFEVGVGDRYGLNFRYQSTHLEPIPLDVVIRNTADGVVVCEDTYVFEPTLGDPWAMLRERTCESTNAGIYAVELSGEGLSHLLFDSLEVE